MANKCASLFILFIALIAVIEARYASFSVNLALTVSDDSHKLSEDMVRICSQETDLSMDELAKFRRNDFSNSSEATQCFAHCIYEQMGLMRDGVFVERDFIRTVADVTDPNVMLLHKKCHEIQAENKCERAYLIHKCLAEQRSGLAVPPKAPTAPEEPAPAAPVQAPQEVSVHETLRA